MKVLLVNGSPRQKMCTYTALEEIADVVNGHGIETEIFQLGSKAISGCIGCGVCHKNRTKKCFMDDKVNEFLDKATDFDGFIFGSPVHFAGLSGAMTSFLDRVFYAGASGLRGKPGVGVVSTRRAGATSAIDQMNKYFTFAQMPIVSSQYWAMVYGNTPDEVRQDLEGMQTMRVLGNNMAWLLKCLEAGRKAGIEFPEKEKRVWTNFIR